MQSSQGLAQAFLIVVAAELCSSDEHELLSHLSYPQVKLRYQGADKLQVSSDG